MTIGEALKQIRHELYLTQEQMCAGVVTRSFYAKVESGRNRISADKLTEILFEHDIDITYFYQLLRNTYSSQSKLKENDLNQKMNQAFNSGKIELIEQNYHKILLQSSLAQLIFQILFLSYFTPFLTTYTLYHFPRILHHFSYNQLYSNLRFVFLLVLIPLNYHYLSNKNYYLLTLSQ